MSETPAPTVEDAADALLSAAYAGDGSIFGGDDAAPETLARRKEAGDLLVAQKLAKHVDEARTEISLTNAGRYWAHHGGVVAFLREMPPTARSRNPELEALRFTYMRLRLNTFWWTFGLAVASFVMSILSLVIAALFGQSLIPGR
ncbi:hypothetical protein [Brevundimonas sp.]|uniref:hypothetical protein n=1 Tax=Brevundimonas sp. TaxID=1871086 RepID=UPI0035B3965C